jgi:hypothetical protein
MRTRKADETSDAQDAIPQRTISGAIHEAVQMRVRDVIVQ